MLTADELLGDDEFLDTSCLASDRCIQELLRDAPAGCLYCALESLGDGEDH